MENPSLWPRCSTPTLQMYAPKVSEQRQVAFLSWLICNRYKTDYKVRHTPSGLLHTFTLALFKGWKQGKQSKRKQMELIIKLSSHTKQAWMLPCLHHVCMHKIWHLGRCFKIFFDCVANSASSRWLEDDRGFWKYHQNKCWSKTFETVYWDLRAHFKKDLWYNHNCLHKWSKLEPLLTFFL